MNEKLSSAVIVGDIKALRKLNKEDPHLLERIDAVPFIDTPLHKAAAIGQTTFALELMIAKPSFARKLNPDHLTPMHLALANGQIETVRGLFDVDKDLVRVKGGEGKTPMHFAVEEARVKILDEFLVGCPDCLSDVTNRRETALHLAVKNNRLKSFGVLVEHIDLNNLDKMFEHKDDQGHTALHLMAMNKQVKMIKGLALYYRYAGRMFGVNVLDENEHTAMEISQGLHRIEESSDTALIKKVLRRSGGSAPNVRFGCIRNFSVRNWYHRSTRKYRKKINTDAQNALLVVAVLIASVTFQVAVTPPSGFWQDTILPDPHNGGHLGTPNAVHNPDTNITSYGNEIFGAHYAGAPIMFSTFPVLFLAILYFNFMAFVTSVFMIVLLTLDLPLRHILRASLASLTITYILSLPLSYQTLLFPILVSVVAFFMAVKVGSYATQSVKFRYPDGDDDDKVEMDHMTMLDA